MTEYLLFIHGVNTRETRDQPTYADQLIEQIQRLRSPQTRIKPVPLYWGDVNIEAEQKLQKRLEESPAWEKLYFKEFRANQFLQFTGDAALYLSRAVGKQIVEYLIQQAESGLQGFTLGTDHIHLITHSLGAIILFDVLFSSRWDEKNAGGYKGVEKLRERIFHDSTPIRSIHTMGFPLGLFSLTTVSDPQLPNTHDITSRLRQYLQDLCGTLKTPFPWRNYLHSMDIIATPIEQLLPEMLGAAAEGCLDVKDIVTQETGIFSRLFSRISQALSLIELEGEVEQVQLAVSGGEAHSNYWSSRVVASTIVQTIEATVRQPQLQPA